MAVYFVKTQFILEEVSRDISWDEFLYILNEPDEEDCEEALRTYEEALYNFISTERVLTSDKREPDDKAIERKITYFCTNSLGINAVTFVELTPVGGDEVYTLLPFLDEEGKEGAGQDDGADDGERDAAADEENAPEIFVACAPVIDPVAGVAASKLSVGDSLYCRLPEDSPYYKICATNVQDFNGVVTAEVTGVKASEFGSSIVALSLADGISVVMKLSGNITVKMAPGGRAAAGNGLGERNRDMIFCAIGVVVLLCVIAIFFHFLT
jgi:hypothetical protein